MNIQSETSITKPFMTQAGMTCLKALILCLKKLV